MSLPVFDELHEAADAAQPRLPIAVAGAADPSVLTALQQAHAGGWVEPILVGAAPEIARVAAAARCEIGGFRIVDAADAARAAVAEVRAGRARLMMKGQVDTPSLLRALLDADSGLRTGRTMCQVVLMEIIDQKRRFLLADTGITVQPTLDQKADILDSLISTAQGLGVGRPRVALLAAAEKATPAIPDTLESAELIRRHHAGEFARAILQGPLSFDLAWSSEAAMKKHVAGDVAGGADAMLFPNLTAANLTVKAIMYTASCRFGGVLCGAACPVAFMSRADTVDTRLNSLALALKST